MKNVNLSLFVLMLLAIGTVSPGCGNADDTNTSTDSTDTDSDTNSDLDTNTNTEITCTSICEFAANCAPDGEDYETILNACMVSCEGFSIERFECIAACNQEDGCDAWMNCTDTCMYTEAVCDSYTGEENCCRIDDPCGWADDAECDCDDTCDWDTADCA